MGKGYTLRDLPEEERPRERLKKVGVDNLSIQELLALVIERGGKKGQTVLTTAQKLLSEFGDLASIKEASLQELQKVEGIGSATACKLKAAFRLGQKAQTKHKRYGQKIETPEDVFNLLKNEIGNKKKEHFRLLSLDSRNCLINIDEISIGTANSSLAHPREIFCPAIKNSAITVILVHNHPSGSLEKSPQDIKTTQELIAAADLLGIGIADHIIISDKEFVSFRRKEWI